MYGYEARCIEIMLGLTMNNDYLNEILDGPKTFDARSYPINKRGKIALIDSRSMKIYGTIELVECREISAEEYCSWHQTGRFQNLIFQVNDENKKYYGYDFKNPQRLAKPIKVDAEKHTWVEVPNDIEFCYQTSLF